MTTDINLHIESYIERVQSLLENLETESVELFIKELSHARDRMAQIFFLGNGGSAATANHFVNDLNVCASPESKKPFRAISLTSNEALLTCLANDFGYDCIFVRQLKNLMAPADLVVGISASGNSPNVIRALEYANANGAITVGLVGFDGGMIKKLAKFVIHVKSETGEYGPVEDIHMILDHLISTFLVKCG